MTSIIVGQNISGSLTSTSPTIVDPTSPFNGQFYDDFDVSSVNVIDPNNLPFLLAASKELGDIGSVKIGEVRSTNIFIQPPAGSAAGAITTIQLINTKTNSVDAQATSSGSEALQFVKNAEISGTDYKVRIINAIPGDYQISLAGAIQAVQVVGTSGTTIVESAAPTDSTIAALDPNVARNVSNGLIFDSTGAVTGAARGIPIVDLPPATDSSIAIDPPTGNQPIPTPSTEGIPLVFPPEQIPIVIADNQPIPPQARNFALPEFMNAVLPESQIPTAIVDPAVGIQPDSIPPGAVSAPAPQVDDLPTPVRGTTPAPNERTVDVSDPSTDPIIAPTLTEIDPRILQSAVGGIPPGAVANAGGGIPSGAVANAGGTLASAFQNIFLTNNFLSTNAATGFGISAISQKPGGKVSEIGIFAIDGTAGAPGPNGPNYLQLIGNSGQSIFSTLGDSFFDSASKREITLAANRIYGFFQVQDGSIADIKQQLASGKTPTNILSSRFDANGTIPIKVTNNSKTGGYNISINNDELVLSVVKLDGTTPNTPIGAKSQGLAEGRTIDLTGLTGTLKADITTKSSAAYNNNIGFYAVEDAIGTIQLANGKTVKPGDVNYAVEAIKSALTNSLQAGKTASKLGQDITGGKIYAPVVVAQGSLSDFLATNPTNIGGGINAYFNYVAANGDKKDHFRLIGNNTFGVEDQYGGGDRDFNDLVVNMNVKQA